MTFNFGSPNKTEIRKATVFALFVHMLLELCTLGLMLLQHFCAFLYTFFKFLCPKNYR